MEIQSFNALLKKSNLNMTGDEVVENLKKALAITNSTATAGAPGPLNLENLDGVMTKVLSTMKHLKMFNYFTKIPSIQPLFQWIRQNSFGETRGSLGFNEGGAPAWGSSSYTRGNGQVRYLGVKGGYTHQVAAVGQQGGMFVDPITSENENRTLQLLTRVDRELVFGDENILDGQGNTVHFNGLLNEMAARYPQNVIDLQGKPLTFEHLDDSSENFITDGKLPSVDNYTCFLSPHVEKGINRQYQDANVVRHNKDTARGSEYQPGFRVPSYASQFGDITFDRSILFEEVGGSKPQAAAGASAPAAPATVGATVANDATSNMVAGTYYYFVSAHNDADESLTTATTAQAVALGQKVTLDVARVSTATAYRVYRGTLADGSDARWIARIAQPTAGNAAFVDKNQWRTLDANGKPESGLAILVEPDPTDIGIAQLAPLVKLDQPLEGTTIPFLLLLYITLVVKAPERVRIYKNCGQYNAI